MTYPIHKKYAVLHRHGRGSGPVGLAVDFGDRGVKVMVPRSTLLAGLYKEPYRVTQRDLTMVEYRPGHDEFFDQVLCELARHFAVGERAEALVDNRSELLDLYREKVLEAQRSDVVTSYSVRERNRNTFHAEIAASTDEEDTDDGAPRELAGVA